MRKVILFCGALALLTACEDTPAKVSNPAKETTLEIQQSVTDTTCHYVVIEDTKITVLNENKEVVAKAQNTDGIIGFLVLLIVILLVALALVLAGN